MAFEKYSTSGVLAYAVPLYLSPVLSGASGVAWAVVPVFALLFAAVIVITRKMPTDGAALAASVLGAVMLNGAITAGLFAVGRGIMLFAGPVDMPVWGPLGICTLAAGWGMWRYRWTPAQDEMEAVLDAALRDLTAMQPPDDEQTDK